MSVEGCQEAGGRMLLVCVVLPLHFESDLGALSFCEAIGAVIHSAGFTPSFRPLADVEPNDLNVVEQLQHRYISEFVAP